METKGKKDYVTNNRYSNNKTKKSELKPKYIRLSPAMP